MAAKYRDSGITGGWRGDIPRQQTFVLILIILVARIVATLLEEKLGSARFGPRRKHVKTYVTLLLKDGAFSFRVLCIAITLAQLFIIPAEMGTSEVGSWSKQSTTLRCRTTPPDESCLAVPDPAQQRPFLQQSPFLSPPPPPCPFLFPPLLLPQVPPPLLRIAFVCTSTPGPVFAVT